MEEVEEVQVMEEVEEVQLVEEVEEVEQVVEVEEVEKAHLELQVPPGDPGAARCVLVPWVAVHPEAPSLPGLG